MGASVACLAGGADAARIATALLDRLRQGAAPPAARRCVRLDLPPSASATAAWLVATPDAAAGVVAPAELAGGAGVRLWHDAARRIGLRPGDPCWAVPLDAPLQPGGAG